MTTFRHGPLEGTANSPCSLTGSRIYIILEVTANERVPGVCHGKQSVNL